MSRSRHSTPGGPTFKRPHRRHGPVVLNEVASRRPEHPFGGAMPDGPLPGRLLVLLSRLHRAESARTVQKSPAPER
ncbi:hypothetical protein Q8W71_16560 [Methylobacterium sp. NEAU 140]|uniref:hypothetical protein n=1 Tax=Methylobacterium sp. NEAU 140 TaxID=3064945 RepID=UPI002735126E|nr:hypothetical protein [Methylobacterium sp. NEAU 140]MDP4024243.1 hypothetical protein [Methylobacterium sp. NEAU 140]